MKLSARTDSSRMFILKILLPAVLALALFVVSLYQFIIPQFEDIILGRKREMIRELTTSAWHVLDRYHQEQQAGRLSENEAKAAAIAQVSHLRYGDEQKDYFWITDYRPFMIDHPFREDLNGTDLSDFTDSHGKHLFVEMVDVVHDHGEGFVDYTWQWKDDSTRIVPKLSYVKSFQPWGWIVGTGIYLEDVHAEISSLENDIILISLWITIAISLLLTFIVLQNLRSERKRQRAENELREAKEKYQALAEASTDGLLMQLDDVEPYMNATLLEMSGYTEAQLGTLVWEDILPDVARDEVRASATDTEGGVQIETRLRRSDGSTLDVLLSTSEVEVFGKTGLLVTVRDIDLHKELSNELHETRERFLSLTGQLPLAVFRTDAGKDMRILEGNAAAAELFGYVSIPGLLGVEFSSLAVDEAAFHELREELSTTGTISHRIMRFRGDDNRRLSLSLSIALVRDDAGDPRYCDIIAEDRSGERDQEQRRRRLLADLQAPLLFLSQPVRTLMQEATVCAMHNPVRGVIRLMARTGSSMILLHDDAGIIVGMIGADELREALLHGDGVADRYAYEIMRSPLLRIPDSGTVQEALSLMIDLRMSALATTSPEGKVIGMLRLEDIHRSSLQSHQHFLRQLLCAESPAEIARERQQLLRTVAVLIENGAGVSYITHTLTTINDTAVHRALGLAIESLGPPPCDFTFITLGSEGRREQTLSTDQDNAIIYTDPDEGHAVLAEKYFHQLGEHVCHALDEAGYPYCPGEMMAMNPRWCQPLSVWKRYFTDWISTSNPQDLLEISIFFDFRCVHGEESLLEQLRDHVFDTASGYHSFFAYLAQNALRIKPPSWTFKAAEITDLKLAMLPIVDLARIYALHHGIHATNTAERLNLLHERGVFSTTGYRDIAQSYELLFSLRLRNQARALAANASVDNLISTASLTDIEKTSLRRAFVHIETFQSKLSVDFLGSLEIFT